MTLTTPMYQDTLLALSRDTRHRGDPSDAPFSARRRNPACGDEICIGFNLEKETLRHLCYHVQGCAVCAASAAAVGRVMEGLSADAARERLRCAFSFFDSDAVWTESWGVLEFPALGAVRAKPMRMACVRLAWEAFEEALLQA